MLSASSKPLNSKTKFLKLLSFKESNCIYVFEFDPTSFIETIRDKGHLQISEAEKCHFISIFISYEL
ncbi:hypothetical protein JCM16358_06020 [Halanaerocella petrolearia]